MHYPELFLLPIFMFADYFLTLAGAVQQEKKYGQHFKIEHYELNPVWQQEVRQHKWFNPKHILLTLLYSTILILLSQYGKVSPAFMEGVAGCVLGLYGLIIGRHIYNLLIFRHLIQHPDTISGQVTMAHSLSLFLSMYQFLMPLIPLILIAVIVPSPFATGVLVGALLMLVLHTIWIKKHRQKQAQQTDSTKTD